MLITEKIYVSQWVSTTVEQLEKIERRKKIRLVFFFGWLTRGQKTRYTENEKSVIQGG